MKEHRIDASGKVLGRLASEVAVLLRGKERPQYDPARFTANKVTVFRVEKIRVSGHKMQQKKYYRHSGYHGGLKEERMEEVYVKDPGRLLKTAVMGMLPKNKLRSRWIKQLTLVVGEMQ